MSTVQKLKAVSVEDYLEGEKHARVRHEYVRGVIHAMAGASVLHNLIALALSSNLRAHLRGSPCRVFQSDMKVRVGDDFYYPDVLVTCDKVDAHAYYQDAPALIVEVLSESTETRDRLEKRLAYQSISRLQEYVLVSQHKINVEIVRRAGEEWEIQTYDCGDTVNFESIELELAIDAIYEDAMEYMGS